MTDTMGRMHSDAQFAGSSSVPAHVEMMGFLGIGNNPMVGANNQNCSLFKYHLNAVRIPFKKKDAELFQKRSHQPFQTNLPAILDYTNFANE